MRIVLIAGMHRSGTSWLAHVLQEHGVDLGSHAEWAAADNPAGFYEDRRFVFLNEQILQAANATWDKPVVVDRETKFNGLSLLFDIGDPAGFKDPRLCWTYPTWKRIYPQAQLVASIRHPDAVAQSLRLRNGIPREQALELWRQANTNLRDWGATFCHYPSGDGLQALIESLGLKYNQDIVDSIYDPHLLHNQAEADRGDVRCLIELLSKPPS